jgi:hypothetical protein
MNQIQKKKERMDGEFLVASSIAQPAFSISSKFTKFSIWFLTGRLQAQKVKQNTEFTSPPL